MVKLLSGVFSLSKFVGATSLTTGSTLRESGPCSITKNDVVIIIAKIIVYTIFAIYSTKGKFEQVFIARNLEYIPEVLFIVSYFSFVLFALFAQIRKRKIIVANLNKIRRLITKHGITIGNFLLKIPVILLTISHVAHQLSVILDYQVFREVYVLTFLFVFEIVTDITIAEYSLQLCTVYLGIRNINRNKMRRIKTKNELNFYMNINFEFFEVAQRINSVYAYMVLKIISVASALVYSLFLFVGSNTGAAMWYVWFFDLVTWNVSGFVQVLLVVGVCVLVKNEVRIFSYKKIRA